LVKFLPKFRFFWNHFWYFWTNLVIFCVLLRSTATTLVQATCQTSNQNEVKTLHSCSSCLLTSKQLHTTISCTWGYHTMIDNCRLFKQINCSNHK
jgi:hypothetical protein